jgi:glyoxylase-like metal-dependent hydrolase (beta-lactamase superfamily II)
MTATLTTLPGLDATAPEPLPFAPDLHVRAFALRRSRGDVLIYAAPAMRALGPVSRWYLNHRHEAMFAGDGADAPLFVHAADRGAVDLHVRGTFSRRHVLDEDLEVIPIPGHTPGATAYLWDSGEHRFLFTGDTIYLADGEWVAAVLDSSDREAYLQSLELIRGLDFDVLVPWGSTAGQPFHAVTTEADKRRRIDAIVERVRRGERR